MKYNVCFILSFLAVFSVFSQVREFDVNIVNNFIRKSQNTELVIYLNDLKSKGGVVPSDIWTDDPIQLAIELKNYMAIKILINNGMIGHRYGAQDDYYSYLKEFILKDNLELVRELINAGIPVGQEDLSSCNLDSQYEMTILLISKSAYPFQKVAWSDGAGSRGSYSLLCSLVSKDKLKLVSAAIKNDNKLVNMLIGNSAYPEMTISNRMLLDLAVSDEMKKLLLSNGAMTLEDFLKSIPYKELEYHEDLYKIKFITSSRLRMRATPSLQASVIGLLDSNTEVLALNTATVNNELLRDTIDQIKGYWYLVKSKDGFIGWVFGGYLQYKDK